MAHMARLRDEADSIKRAEEEAFQNKTKLRARGRSSGERATSPDPREVASPAESPREVGRTIPKLNLNPHAPDAMQKGHIPARMRLATRGRDASPPPSQYGPSYLDSPYAGSPRSFAGSPRAFSPSYSPAQSIASPSPRGLLGSPEDMDRPMMISPRDIEAIASAMASSGLAQ